LAPAETASPSANKIGRIGFVIIGEFVGDWPGDAEIRA